MKDVILDNRNYSLREIARDLSISDKSVRSILVDILGMRLIAARLVLKELNFLQKHYREQVSLDILNRANDDPTFAEHITAGDETWVYEFDMQTDQESSEWRANYEPQPKIARQSRFKGKVMHIIFFDICGLVHHEFVSERQTVNKEYCLAILKYLRIFMYISFQDTYWQNGRR